MASFRFFAAEFRILNSSSDVMARPAPLFSKSKMPARERAQCFEANFITGLHGRFDLLVDDVG
jgi:hypothetical protein